MTCVISTWYHSRLFSWKWEAWYECLKINVIVQKKTFMFQTDLKTSYSGKLKLLQFIFRNQLKYIIISFPFLQLISLRLPREVISFGQLSRGSDVYTLAMLFYQVYMAFSVHNDLQTVPFSRKHRSCVNRRLFSDQSYFIWNQSFY